MVAKWDNCTTQNSEDTGVADEAASKTVEVVCGSGGEQPVSGEGEASPVGENPESDRNSGGENIQALSELDLAVLLEISVHAMGWPDHDYAELLAEELDALIGQGVLPEEHLHQWSALVPAPDDYLADGFDAEGSLGAKTNLAYQVDLVEIPLEDLLEIPVAEYSDPTRLQIASADLSDFDDTTAYDNEVGDTDSVSEGPSTSGSADYDSYQSEELIDGLDYTQETDTTTGSSLDEGSSLTEEAPLVEESTVTSASSATTLSQYVGAIMDGDAAAGVVTVADSSLLDFETATSHNITILAISSDGSTSSQVYTIALTDADEFDVTPVSASDAAADQVTENAANGTLVGVTAFATDADAGDTVSYSLSDDAGGRFAIDAATGVVTVADGSLLDYETATSHDITVLATSSDGSTSSQVYTISLTDVGEGPTLSVSDVVVTEPETTYTPQTAVVTGTIAETSPAGTYSVDQWTIQHNGGALEIDVLTSLGDGEIVLYRDNGDGTYTRIASNDIGGAAGSGDGSTSTYDPYLNISDLSAGTYLLAISGSLNLDDSEALNFTDPYPVTASYDVGTYQITFTGDTVVTGMPPVDTSGTATIVNDGSDLATVQSTTVTFTVTLDSAPTAATGPITVDYTTADGTATIADGDYLATSGTLTFNEGETTKTVTVTVYSDDVIEGSESFSLQFTNLSANATLDPDGQSIPGGIEAQATVNDPRNLIEGTDSGFVQDTGTINSSNVLSTDQGITVTGRCVTGGTLSSASATNIGFYDGAFGVQGAISDSDSGVTEQTGYDKASGLSEELIVDFDNAIDSATVSFKHLMGSFTEVGYWTAYSGGVVVAEGSFSGTADGTGSFTIDPGVTFDRIVFTGILQTDTTDGSDFSISQIDYTEAAVFVDGADTITGTSWHDDIYAYGGNDTIDGGAGDDYIVGGAGSDIMTGGAGADIFFFESAGSDGDTITDFTQGEDLLDLSNFAFTADFDALTIQDDGFGNAHIFLPSGDDVLLLGIAPGDVNVADVVTLWGSDGDDVLTGNSGADGIHGKDGNDLLDGGADKDALVGGAGDDVFIWDSNDVLVDGGSGNDTLRAINGDNIDYNNNITVSGIDTIDLETDSDSNTLKLDAQFVLDTTDDRVLTVTGDAADDVDIGSGWSEVGLNTDGLMVYTQTVGVSTATLMIDPLIAVNSDVLA